jgi:transcriptional regulator with XRE-family HTH domain
MKKVLAVVVLLALLLCSTCSAEMPPVQSDESEGGRQMSFNEALSQNMRRLREERGWTPEELAFHSELSLSTIHALEDSNSRRRPRDKTLKQIAKALECTISDLTKETSEQQEDTRPAYRILCKGASRLNDADLEKLLEVAQTLFAEAFED